MILLNGCEVIPVTQFSLQAELNICSCGTNSKNPLRKPPNLKSESEKLLAESLIQRAIQDRSHLSKEKTKTLTLVRRRD